MKRIEWLLIVILVCFVSAIRINARQRGQQQSPQKKTSQPQANPTHRTLAGRWFLQVEKSSGGEGADAIPKPESCEIAVAGPKVTITCSEIVLDHHKREIRLGTKTVNVYFADGRGDPGTDATSTKWIETGKKLETKFAPRNGLQETNTWELSPNGDELTFSMHYDTGYRKGVFKKVYERSEQKNRATEKKKVSQPASKK